MARIRKSKANTKYFIVIPTKEELNDEKLMKKKYKDKRCLGRDE